MVVALTTAKRWQSRVPIVGLTTGTRRVVENLDAVVHIHFYERDILTKFVGNTGIGPLPFNG